MEAACEFTGGAGSTDQAPERFNGKPAEAQPEGGLCPCAGGRRNLRGAFALVPGENWQGRQIVIVDDVITSGYTFSTVADLAAAQGGRPLGVFVARTEMDGGGKDSVEKLQTV